MKRDNKRLPPYGKLLQSFFDTNIIPAFPIYIFCGKQSIQEANKHLSKGIICCALPFEKSFTQFNWPLKNGNIILFDTGDFPPIEAKKFTFHLLNKGVFSVCVYSETAFPNPVIEFYSNK